MENRNDFVITCKTNFYTYQNDELPWHHGALGSWLQIYKYFFQLIL